MNIDASPPDTRKPVLLLTQDGELWQRWRSLEQYRWLPARGRELADLSQWLRQGHDLALLDGSLPRLPDWDSPAWPLMLNRARLVVASSHPTEDDAMRILKSGAGGYCHAYSPSETLASALEAVATGGVWLGRALMSRLLRQIDARFTQSGDWAEGLTQRENRVARLAAGGYANPQIAAALGITERTVRAHLSSVFDKLGVVDRLQLTLRVHGIAVPADA